MSNTVDIRVPPEKVNNEQVWKRKIVRKLGISSNRIQELVLVKKSIDARGKSPVYQLRIEVFLKGERIPDNSIPIYYNHVEGRKKVLVIGAGPCGYFAALKLLELELCPVVIERGKDVRSRRKDLRQIQQFHSVNPDSNYCFGEGGAGTYSDGKLYTRSIKRGNVKKILEVLVNHGASRDILVDAHPHIGSNKLPNIIAAIRQTILNSGGEIHFNTRVEKFIVDNCKIKGVVSAEGISYKGESVVLCTGHGARDIYHLCHNSGVQLEFKPFAMGMRLEHPQNLIDEIQYNRKNRGEHLPAASYSLSCQVSDSGVFSFCMCPGGLIVPAATSPGELVVNGMSLSKRNSPFANAAVVNAIDQNPEPGNPFGGVNYQAKFEQMLFQYGDGSQKAPAQRLTDFMESRISSDLPDTSYIPGIYPAPLHELLPRNIVENIRGAIKVFDKRMKGYYTAEAQFVGLESRTSAPVRIPRKEKTLMSPDIEGLFPAGEGAGYAGGILSAALDGERIASAVKAYIHL